MVPETWQPPVGALSSTVMTHQQINYGNGLSDSPGNGSEKEGGKGPGICAELQGFRGTAVGCTGGAAGGRDARKQEPAPARETGSRQEFSAAANSSATSYTTPSTDTVPPYSWFAKSMVMSTPMSTGVS